MKWKKIKSKEDAPPPMHDVLLYADGKILKGWNESVQPEEDPSYCSCEDGLLTPEEVTHWMKLPKAPND